MYMTHHILHNLSAVAGCQAAQTIVGYHRRRGLLQLTSIHKHTRCYPN